MRGVCWWQSFTINYLNLRKKSKTDIFTNYDHRNGIFISIALNYYDGINFDYTNSIDTILKKEKET